MNYLEAFEADLRQNPPSAKIDKTDKPPRHDRPQEGFGDIVSFGSGGKLAGSPGAVIASPPGTAWAHLTCPERARLLMERGVPESWAVGIADIGARSKPKNIDQIRWARVLADATTLTAALPEGDCWVTRLHHAGWSLIDIFCLDPERPDARPHRAGLCWSLKGSMPASIEPCGAVKLTSGRLVVRPSQDSGRELLWRLWA